MNKQLNFVMISPHFPANFETFAHRLHENGINTLGIADAPFEELSEGLRNSLTEYYRVDDMEDYNQMYRAVAYFAWKYGKIDRIESHNEYWLETDAKLRTDFNVFGFKEKDMDRIKHKSAMKEIFIKNGIPAAKGRVFKDKRDAEKLARSLKFPVIIKPNSGVGASNTWKIKNRNELNSFFDEADQSVEYIMEEYIPGDIVTFDGLTDQDGNIVFYSSLVHDKPVLDIVEDDTDMFYYIARDIPEKLVELGKKAVKAFDIKERFFHFEFFKLDNGNYMGLEINCRPPGGVTIDMFNYANDIDIFNEYAHIVKYNKFMADLNRPYNAAYTSRKEHKNYVHSHDEIISTYKNEIISAETIPGVFSAVLGDIGYIFKTPSFDKMKEIITFISETK